MRALPRPHRAFLPLAGLLLALLAAMPAVHADEGTGKVPAALAEEGDTVWKGALLVHGQLVVPSGRVLEIEPGTEVAFEDGASLLVDGVLVSEGTAEAPIRFSGAAADRAAGSWEGITLRAADDRTRLRHCTVRDAAAVTIAAGAPRIEACAFEHGRKGIVVSGKETTPAIRDCRFADLEEGGVDATSGGAPQVTDCVFERCGRFGVGASGEAVPVVVRATVSGSEVGILISNTAPAVRDCTLRRNGTGIVLSQVAGGRPVQGNRVLDSDTGIRCENFSSAEIVGNLVAGNGTGISCVRGAHPLVRNNTIRGNGTGLAADQIANPTVSANDFRDNERGVYLNLSSYAVITGNNIAGSPVLLELGNMSADWENRVGGKPMRGLRRRSQGRFERGVDLPPGEGLGDGAAIEEDGVIDARGNWWGAEVTREMEEAGPDANIRELIDAFDVPTRVYEGYEGEYKQDRIRYAPWAQQPIPSAGAPPDLEEAFGEGRRATEGRTPGPAVEMHPSRP